MSVEFLRQFAESSEANLELLMAFLQRLADNVPSMDELQEDLEHIYLPVILAKMVMLEEPRSNGEVKRRPVFCEEAIFKVWVAYAWQLARSGYADSLGYANLGVGAKAGTELLVKSLQMAIENMPHDPLYRLVSDHLVDTLPDGGLSRRRRIELLRMPVLVTADAQNFFNSCDRNAIRRVYVEDEKVGFMGQPLELMTAAPRPYVYFTSAGETKVRYFELGLNQGNSVASAACSAVKKEMDERAARLMMESEPVLANSDAPTYKPSSGTAISSYIDDGFGVLPLTLAAQFYRNQCMLAPEYGLSFAHSKTKILPLSDRDGTRYEDLTAEDMHWIATVMGVDNQSSERPQQLVVPKVVVVGCPFVAPATDGTDEHYLNTHIAGVINDAKEKMQKIVQSPIPVEAADRMVRDLSSTAITHLCRMLPPSVMTPHCREFDRMVEDMFMRLTGTTTLTPQQLCQLHLPLGMSGMGMQSAEKVVHYASWASWAQLAVQLTHLKSIHPNTIMPGVRWRQESATAIGQIAQFGESDWLPPTVSENHFWPFYYALSRRYNCRGEQLKVQRALTRIRHRRDFHRLLEEVDNAGKARLLSLSAKGAAAWLTQTPNARRSMTSSHYILALRFRIGLPLFRALFTRCHRGCDDSLVDGNPYHLMQCKKTNKTLKNQRHNALMGRLVRYLRDCGCVVHEERHHWDEEEDRLRPDMVWQMVDGAEIITDMKVTCPLAPSNIAVAQSILGQAHSVESTTHNKYLPITNNNRRRILTACMETPGAQGYELRRLMRRAKRSWMQTRVEGLAMDWQAELIGRVADGKMVEATQDMAVLLQRWNAQMAILEHRQALLKPGVRASMREAREVEEVGELLERAGRLW
jgi:hypothetical protein